MSIVGKDIEVLDSFFNKQEEIAVAKFRKEMWPFMVIMCLACLVMGTQLVASPKEQPSILTQAEIPTLPMTYDFMAPLPELISNPLELPPTFNNWEIVN